MASIAFSPSAMASLIHASRSFAMRGLLSATARGQASSKKAMPLSLVGKSGAIAAVLFGQAEKSLCYSGAVFVPGTDSFPSDVGITKEYDVDALLSAQQWPLGGNVLLRTFLKYWIFHEAIHANAYFMEIDRLEQEEFERGGGPLEAWPPYVTGPRQWVTMSSTVARATARETAVKLVRLALANAAVRSSSSMSPFAGDSPLLSRRKRSAFKLLKDASKSAARKRDLATAAADSLLLESSSSSIFERLGARTAAKWRKGPALAASAGATAFRSGFLFAAADFIVSVATETAKALWDAAKEQGGEERDATRRQGDSSSSSSLQSRAVALYHSVSGAVASSLASVSSADAMRSLTTALVYAFAAPRIMTSKSSSSDVLVISDGSSSSDSASSFLPVAGLAAAALALAAAGASLRSALGDDRADALAKSVSRSAVRVAAGLSATSAAYGLAVACPWLPPWTWPALQLASDNAAHVLLVGPAVAEQSESGRVGRARAGLLSAALAAAAVATVGVL